MKAWKRNLLIAYLVCNIVALVFYFLLIAGSTMPGFGKALLVLLGIVLVAGVGVGGCYVVYAFIHEHATLHAGPEGTINIERSALESTAKRAMSSVAGVRLQRVTARVLARQGEPVIDLAVTAVPFGTESLMTVAGRIQATVKQAVEGFTDHEVRYVAVSFVEPRKREEVKAAKQSVDVRAAGDCPAPRYTPAKAAADGTVTGSYTVEEAKPSLWERARSMVDGLRSKKDEDVVETAAVVESVASPAAKAPSETAQPAPAAAPSVDLDDDLDSWTAPVARPDAGKAAAVPVPDEPVEGAAVKGAGGN